MQPAKAFDGRDLRLRLASAALLGPAALVAVWFGGWIFLIVMAVASALLAIEWGLMSAPGRPARVAWAISVVILVALFLFYTGWQRSAWASLVLGAVGAAAIARGFSERLTDAAFGVLYIGVPVLLVIWLRTGTPEFAQAGRAWVFLLMLTVWAADGGAYFTGKTFGGPKLWPRFSPNKTWSGFFGGLVAAAATALAFTQVFSPEITATTAVVLGVATGAAAMAGDLWESMLKRRFGVKDSGALIPGHGGLLDRVDGLMFAAIAVAAFRWLVDRGVIT